MWVSDVSVIVIVWEGIVNVLIFYLYILVYKFSVIYLSTIMNSCFREHHCITAFYNTILFIKYYFMYYYYYFLWLVYIIIKLQKAKPFSSRAVNITTHSTIVYVNKHVLWKFVSIRHDLVRTRLLSARGLHCWWDSPSQKTFVRMRLRQQEIFSKTRYNILPFKLREVRGDDYVTCVGWLFFCCHKRDGIYNNNTIYCYLFLFFFSVFVRPLRVHNLYDATSQKRLETK